MHSLGAFLQCPPIISATSSLPSLKTSAVPMSRNMKSSNNISLKVPRTCCSADVQDASPRGSNLQVHGLSQTVVGVLGGGQLGRMLCEAASQIAIKVIILDPVDNCPASSICHDHMVGSYDDSATVEEFAKRCGVLTVEIEHVDIATLEKLEQQGVDCQPKASTIRIIQYSADYANHYPAYQIADKYLQKVHFSRHEIPLTKFMEIDDLEGAKSAGDLFGYPLMIKSKRLAYDGRGNAAAKNEDEISLAVNAQKRNRLAQHKSDDLVFVKYNRALKRRYDIDDVINPILLNEIGDSNEWLIGKMDGDNEEDDEFVFSREDGSTHKDVAKTPGAGEPHYNYRSNASPLGGYAHGLYVEKWAPFVKELSVIVARGTDNTMVCYPVVETIHR
ncbi:hypothetical protein OROGR_013063 [Orobanche gracilis]